VRLNGAVKQLNHPPLTNEEIETVAKRLMKGDQWKNSKIIPTRLSYVLPNVSRFRVNVYRERGGCAMVLRVVQLNIRQFDELGLPGY
jgi:twitching motility protein PilT